jgi:hypothetical protein
MPCVNTILLNRYQAEIDAQDRRDTWEDNQWCAFWDEIEAAEKSGALSSWAVGILTKAVEDHGIIPEPEEEEPDCD